MSDYKAVLESLVIELLPVGDRVAVLPDEEETVSASGLVIPDTVENDVKQAGTVIAVGTGDMGKDCIDPKEHFMIGHRVLFGKYVGDDVMLKRKDGTEVKVKILRADAILAYCKLHALPL